MLEVIESADQEEDPAQPLMRIEVTLAGGEGNELHYHIHEQLNGIDGAVAATVTLQLAAQYLDQLCPDVNQNGRGSMLLHAVAHQIKNHYEAFHTDGDPHGEARR